MGNDDEHAEADDDAAREAHLELGAPVAVKRARVGQHEPDPREGEDVGDGERRAAPQPLDLVVSIDARRAGLRRVREVQQAQKDREQPDVLGTNLFGQPRPTTQSRHARDIRCPRLHQPISTRTVSRPPKREARPPRPTRHARPACQPWLRRNESTRLGHQAGTRHRQKKRRRPLHSHSRSGSPSRRSRPREKSVAPRRENKTGRPLQSKLAT